MTDLIYKDLSYKITGLIYEVSDLVGFGQNEKVYGDAFSLLLERDKINFQREIYFPIKIENKVIKKYYFDFLVDDKIVIELKATDINFKQACTQLFRYLKASNLKLGLIYRFTKNGVRIKRIPNLY